MAQLASVGGLAGTRETVLQFGLLMNWSESASERKPEDIMLGVELFSF